METNNNQTNPQKDNHAKKSKLFPTSSDDDCMRYLYDDVRTLFDVMSRGQKVSGKLILFLDYLISICLIDCVVALGDGACLGRIDKTGKGYEWISFSDAIKRIKDFGAGLVHLGLKEGTQTKIGIYATNCLEYVIAEYGAYNHSMTIVPLYDTLGPNAVTFIINQAEIELAIVDNEDRLNALISQVTNVKCLKQIIVLGNLIESYRSKAKGVGVNVYTVQEVEDMGREHPKECLV